MRLNNELAKQIAVFKLNNPTCTVEEIAEAFGVKVHQARYAIDKYAENAEFLKSNRKGRRAYARATAESGDTLELMKKQLALIMGELEADEGLVIKTRTQLLYQATKIKMYLQECELESHLKTADARIIAAIIRRFLPDADNDQIIKIYNEEMLKLGPESKANKKGRK